MPKLLGFGDDVSADSGESWILSDKLGKDKVITLSRGTETLTCHFESWRRFQAAGDGWKLSISAERTVETVDIELQVENDLSIFILNYNNGSHPKHLLTLRSEGARSAYVFPAAMVVFREPWRDSELGRNIRAFVEFRPYLDSAPVRGYLMLAALLYWSGLPTYSEL